LSVGKTRDFPLLSVKNDKGSRVYTNDLANQTFVLCKIQLEDLIKFHDVKFQIIRGYYFDEGFNPLITTEIQNVFEMRKKEKAKKSPL